MKNFKLTLTISFITAGLLSFLVSSCNNEVEKDLGNKIDSTKEVIDVRIDSSVIIFEAKKQIIYERIMEEIEKIDAKQDEIRDKQDKAKEKIRAKTKEEILELKTKKNKLDSLLKNFESITKDNWETYEDNLERIIDGNQHR